MSTRPFSESPWPSATNAVQALLAACMADQEVAEKATELVASEDLRDSSDWGDTWASIFTAVDSLVKQGRRAAPFMVGQEMLRLNLTSRRDITDVLNGMVAQHMGGVPVEEYCQVIADNGFRRRLRTAGHQWVDLANRHDLSLEEREAQAQAIASALHTGTIATKEPVNLGDLIRQRVEVHRQRKVGEFTGLRTGFTDMDDLILGLHPGDLIILAARPSMGKTALSQQIAMYNAKEGKKVGFVSVEMPGAQLADRAIASEGGVKAGDIRAGLVHPRQWDTALVELERRGVLHPNLFVVDDINTVPQSRSWALRVKRRHGLDLLVIDYLQIMAATGAYRGNRVQEVSEISRGIKALAKELQVPVIALSQLSRELERREDKRPILSDLRESGSIEQDADMVLFLYRDDYYRPESEDKGIAELLIAKHRNGSLGMTKLAFFKEKVRFGNYARR